MPVQRSVPGRKQQFIATHNFANGTQLCMVREAPTSEPSLLFWNGSNATVRSRFKIEGHWYKPLRLAPDLLRNLRLPPPPRPYGSVEKLAASIATAFRQLGGVTDQQARLLAYICISTWFPRCLSVAPCLSIASPVAADRVLILHLLSCFCRYAVMLAEPSRESLLHFPPGLEPTMLTNYWNVPRRVQGVFNAGCYRGTPIPSAKGEMVDLFGMKVVAAPEPVIWLESAIHLAIPPRQNGPATCWDEAVLGPIAWEFQPQLLRYSLEHQQEVAASNWDVPEFVSPVREIARSLGRCLCSAKLREDLAELLREQEEEARMVWSCDHRAIVIEGALVACHDPGNVDDPRQPSGFQEKCYVGDLAQIANGILKDRGEQTTLTSRRVGAILNAVGLRTERLGQAGRGLRLDKKIREEIHGLAGNYGVRSISQVFEGCPECKVFARSDGRRS